MISTDLCAVAQAYVDREDTPPRPGISISRLANLTVRLDTGYCRDVATYFDQAPLLDYDPALRRLYDRIKRENREQFAAIRDSGIEIAGWHGPGQPYRNSRELIRRVRETGRLYVYLTRAGHGPGATAGFHPMRAPAGLTARGIELTHNDVFRAVHDIFGHVMSGNSFGPAGELSATYCHLHMYSPEVHPILLSEQVGQICWFFFGPHLRDRDGRLPAPGDPDYRPPRGRPYAAQKVFTFDPGHVAGFTRMFDPARPADPPVAAGEAAVVPT